MKPVGDRDQRVRRAAWDGAIGAALYSVPISLFLSAWFWYSALPMEQRGAIVFHTLLWTNVCWISIAAVAQANRLGEETMTPEHRRLVQNHVFWAAVEASCFAVPVAAFYVVATWGYGPTGAVIGAPFVLSLWVGCACAVGHARGLSAVRAAEERDRLAATLLDPRLEPKPGRVDSSDQLTARLPRPNDDGTDEDDL